MPLIHRLSEIDLKENKSPIPYFSWKSSLPLEEISKSKYLYSLRKDPPAHINFTIIVMGN
jgi:hypothetical protein